MTARTGSSGIRDLKEELIGVVQRHRLRKLDLFKEVCRLCGKALNQETAKALDSSL
jgi:hypothetical protein